MRPRPCRAAPHDFRALSRACSWAGCLFWRQPGAVDRGAPAGDTARPLEEGRQAVKDSEHASAATPARRSLPSCPPSPCGTGRSISARGFPDTDGPADLIAAAAAALTDGRNQYPPLTGVAELRAAVAATNARFYGLTVDPDTEVVVTSGATEAITACLMALLDPGDEVVLIEPLYDTYLPVVRMLGAVPRLVRLAPPRLGAAARRARRRVRAAHQGDPAELADEPGRQGILAGGAGFVAGLLQHHDAYAVCDEVYEHLVFDGVRHVPLMTLPGMRERCLRIGSAGKTFSLTGWKVGYITAPHALGGIVAKAHQNLTFATPPNLQRAVAVGLAKDDAYFAGLAVDLAGKRDNLAAGLARSASGCCRRRAAIS